MSKVGTARPSARGGVAVEKPDRASCYRTLSAAHRSVIAGFTKGDIGRGSLERCVAVLLREGMDLRTLTQLEGLTRNGLRETAESVIRRVILRMDQPETPPNASKIKRRYRDSKRYKAEGAAPLSSLDEESLDVSPGTQDQPYGSLIDWDALGTEEFAGAAEHDENSVHERDQMAQEDQG